MGKRLLLDAAPTGVQHYAEVDNDGDQLTLIEYTPTEVEDVILDDCARLRDMSQRRGTGMQHAARIPIGTWEIWRKEWAAGPYKTMSWGEFEVMKLNSRDNCRLRTGKGRGVYGKRL